MPSHIRFHVLPVAALLRCGISIIAAGGVAHPAMAGTLTFPAPPAGFQMSMSGPLAAVPRDKAVGSTLGSGSVMTRLGTSGVDCPVRRQVTINGTRVSGRANVYQTSVSGIGVIFRMTRGFVGTYAVQPSDASFNVPRPDSGAWNLMRADFVVTGPVASGPLENLPTMTVTFSGSCFPTVTVMAFPPTGQIVMAPTCRIGQSVTTVRLPEARVGGLLPVGRSTGRTNFNLDVSCSGASQVHMTVADANDAGNTGTLLTPEVGEAAHGVRLRMLRNGIPLSFGPDSAVAGTTNQFKIGLAQDIQGIPLSVEYVSVAPVGSGPVNARATFTLSYQ